MTLRDRIRLGTLIGIRHPELFTPDTDSGDNGLLAEWLLSAGYSIKIHKGEDGPYCCTIEGVDAFLSVAAPSRREALCLAAIGLCQ